MTFKVGDRVNIQTTFGLMPGTVVRVDRIPYDLIEVKVDGEYITNVYQTAFLTLINPPPPVPTRPVPDLDGWFQKLRYQI